jgi:hypothetical protein
MCEAEQIWVTSVTVKQQIQLSTTPQNNLSITLTVCLAAAVQQVDTLNPAEQQQLPAAADSKPAATTYTGSNVSKSQHIGVPHICAVSAICC